MFTQLLLCGFLYVLVNGKLKMLFVHPSPRKKPHFFLSGMRAQIKWHYMYKSLLARHGGFWGAESLSFVSRRLQVERVSSYLVCFFLT